MTRLSRQIKTSPQITIFESKTANPPDLIGSIIGSQIPIHHNQIASTETQDTTQVPNKASEEGEEETLFHFLGFIRMANSLLSTTIAPPQTSSNLIPTPSPLFSRSRRALPSTRRSKRLVMDSARAVWSGGVWDGESGGGRRGIWSIRDDLQMPSSPYFPVEAQGGQGPPPMVQERFQSVISQLFQHRIIRCGGPVDDDMANIIVGQLLYLDAVNPTKDIIMYVNSPGGSVTAGMAIFDTMRHIRPAVSTVCVGLAASMGAFILSSGTKGKRYSLPNSRIMIHQPLGGAQGGQTDIDIQANEMLHHKANLNGYLAYHTGQSLEKINQDTDRDFFMSAKEAKDYGLIDGVIFNPMKALQPLPATEESEASPVL